MRLSRRAQIAFALAAKFGSLAFAAVELSLPAPQPAASAPQIASAASEAPHRRVP
jgi:hypothetical protein